MHSSTIAAMPTQMSGLCCATPCQMQKSWSCTLQPPRFVRITANAGGMEATLAETSAGAGTRARRKPSNRCRTHVLHSCASVRSILHIHRRTTWPIAATGYKGVWRS